MVRVVFCVEAIHDHLYKVQLAPWEGIAVLVPHASRPSVAGNGENQRKIKLCKGSQIQMYTYTCEIATKFLGTSGLWAET